MRCKFTISTALCLSILGGCQEIDTPDELLCGSTITISASGEGAQTRTALAGGTGEDRNNVVFTASDKLAVFDLSNNIAEFTMIGSPKSDGSADFAGTVNEDDDRYYALFPYSDEAASTLKTVSGSPAYSTLVSEVPTIQQAVAGSFDPAAALSAGVAFKSGNSCTLQLYNLCSLIKFSIPDDITFSKVVFKANGGEDIAGAISARVSHSTGEVSQVSVSMESTGESSEVTLQGTIKGGNWYYISVIPQELSSGFGIYFYDDNDAVVSSHVTSKEVTLSRNKILNLGELQAVATLEWTGSGTSSDPYLIYTFEQLDLLAQRVKSSPSTYAGKCYKQMANINCGGRTIGIAGCFSGSDVYFTGTYDGNGYSVKGYIPGITTNGKNKYSGLFTMVKNATIKNLTVQPDLILTTSEATPDIYYAAGAIAGKVVSGENSKTVISGCTVLEGSYYVDMGAPYSSIVCRIGGIAGTCEDCNLEITGCTNRADIYVTGGMNINYMHLPEGIGGILGYAESDEFEQIIRIDRCRNTGNMSDFSRTAAMGVGGIVGAVYEDTGTDETVLRISSCVNEGALKAMNPNNSFDYNGVYSFSETYYSYAGGIVGYHGADGGTYDPYIYNCLNKGHIEAADQFGAAGGIIGYTYDDDTTIALCVNVGTFSGEEDTKFGAISAAGSMAYWPDEENARIVGCYWLDPYDSPADPALPALGDDSDTAPYDCYHYKEITSEHPAGRIRNGWNTDRTEWTQSQWDSCAGLWKGSATYGQTQSEITLDLDI